MHFTEQKAVPREMGVVLVREMYTKRGCTPPVNPALIKSYFLYKSAMYGGLRGHAPVTYTFHGTSIILYINLFYKI